ncbi:MAG: hypothetical protein EOM87_06120 [Clostridia bacterium]|nr:hypothetical protein [Clostridia bacterium]
MLFAPSHKGIATVNNFEIAALYDSYRITAYDNNGYKTSIVISPFTNNIEFRVLAGEDPYDLTKLATSIYTNFYLIFMKDGKPFIKIKNKPDVNVTHNMAQGYLFFSISAEDSLSILELKDTEYYIVYNTEADDQNAGEISLYCGQWISSKDQEGIENAEYVRTLKASEQKYLEEKTAWENERQQLLNKISELLEKFSVEGETEGELAA